MCTSGEICDDKNAIIQSEISAWRGCVLLGWSGHVRKSGQKGKHDLHSSAGILSYIYMRRITCMYVFAFLKIPPLNLAAFLSNFAS